MPRIGILLSGGVDSSYCAYLLKNHAENFLPKEAFTDGKDSPCGLSQGRDENDKEQQVSIYGVYLKLHDDEAKHAVYIKNCELLAQKLGIHFEVLNLQEIFRANIIDDFLAGYHAARTPNPCALCNPTIKFGQAFSYLMDKYACEFIASGHYAKRARYNGSVHIAKAKDLSKDQSYFLYGVAPKIRARLLFPLGDMLKSEIKPKALASMPFLGDLSSYKDSQEICFVKTNYLDVLGERFDTEQVGNILDTSGRLIGKHKGYMHYTVGQRRGLDIPLASEPHYVLAVNSDNTIVAGLFDELAQTEIESKSPNNEALPEKPLNAASFTARIRYRGRDTEASITKTGNILKAHFAEPVYGVSAGQSLVVYDGHVVVDGGEVQE